MSTIVRLCAAYYTQTSEHRSVKEVKIAIQFNGLVATPFSKYSLTHSFIQSHTQFISGGFILEHFTSDNYCVDNITKTHTHAPAPHQEKTNKSTHNHTMHTHTHTHARNRTTAISSGPKKNTIQKSFGCENTN